MKTAFLVDVSNLYFCANRDFGNGKIDYRKFPETHWMIAYGNRNSNEANKFIIALQNLGYITKFSDVGDRHNVEIACDVFRIIDRVDLVIFGTSDPSILEILKLLRERGVKTFIRAIGISQVLRQAADGYMELGVDYLEPNKTDETQISGKENDQ